MRRMVSCTLAGLLLWASGSAALAQGKTAVLGVEPVDAPAELAGRLGEALRTQVRQSPGFRLIPGKSLEEIKLVFGCVDEKPECMARVGRSLGASKLLWGTLRKSGADYNLTIKYLDVAGASIEKFVSENISAADLGVPRVQAVVERLTSSFLPGARGALRIGSNVEGAEVQVGGRAVGATRPAGLVVRQLPPGSVEIRISKPGYRPWFQTVIVSAGETASVDAQLEATGEPEVQPATRPATRPLRAPTPASRTGWKAAFWTAAALTVGLGGAIIGSGVTELQREEDKDRAIRAYGGTNRELFNDPNKDACEAAEKVDDAGSIQSVCESGKKWAAVTNVFIGLTAAAAFVSGFFYYKAFIKKEAVEPGDEPGAGGAARKPRSVDWVLAPSAGLQGGGLGLHMRF